VKYQNSFENCKGYKEFLIKKTSGDPNMLYTKKKCEHLDYMFLHKDGKFKGSGPLCKKTKKIKKCKFALVIK